MNDDTTFKYFAKNLEFTIENYKIGEQSSNELILAQCKQFTALMALEEEFRINLIRNGVANQVYLKFIDYICNERRNLLLSRPYFRERQDTCIGPITRGFKLKDTELLSRFHINYQFINYVIRRSNIPWGPEGNSTALSPSLKTIARQVEKIRNEIIELNMPLAISQARLFWKKAPAKTKDTRFSLMDFVQSAADGLMSAVDKFCVDPALLVGTPEAIRVWRAVAIGRMRGNFIEMFSDTTLHFWPTDKRKIYRANKHTHKFKNGIDFELLAKWVNEDLAEDGITTTPEEIRQLVFAANMNDGPQNATINGQNLFTEDSWNKDGSAKNSTVMDVLPDREDARPDLLCEDLQLKRSLKDGIEGLSIFEQKLLQLHGIRIEDLC